MKICRVKLEHGQIILAGVADDEQVKSLRHPNRIISSWEQLTAASAGRKLGEAVNELAARGETIGTFTELESQDRLLSPLDRQEVWAAGVTYLRSRVARMEESDVAASIYDLVYDAERPELFFKATPHRVVGTGDHIGIRGDSRWNVPEPELAILLGSDLTPLGFTVCNDVSSRDIEGANPLYLPQAKVYDRCCAVGPAILLIDELPDTLNLRIECTIKRAGTEVFHGGATTAQLKRTLTELVAYLGRYNSFPDGVLLSTGTCIVPPSDFTLQGDDVVEIEIESIGRLVNPVKVLD